MSSALADTSRPRGSSRAPPCLKAELRIASFQGLHSASIQIMSKTMIDHYRLVIASPSDVQKEREKAKEIVDELNDSVFRDRDIRIDLYRWKTDSYPNFRPEGPQ